MAAWGWECAPAVVVKVYDGDSVLLRCGGQEHEVRLARIDAPEYRQPFGPQARTALERRLAGGELEMRTVAVDRYERVVAELRIEGRDVGLEQVAAGWAWCGSRPRAACSTREAQARERRRGLWAGESPQPPWQWRRQNPR